MGFVLTAEEARRTFAYDGGLLFWRVNPPSRGVPASKPIGNLTTGGYRTVGWKYKKWAVHRLVFLIVHGYLPPDVDHINGNRDDNRVENLRAASRSDNLKNARKRCDNTSGVKGVHWDSQRGKWKAEIKVNGKKLFLGFADNPQDLTPVVCAARKQHHGAFANDGRLQSD